MHPLEPSQQLVQQRIRNRLIEYLEMLVAYETEPPPFDLNEAVNQWEDWSPSPTSTSDFAAPVYTRGEAESLASVGNAWEAFCKVTPNKITDEISELHRPEWKNLLSAARSALSALSGRGKLDEEQEISS
jgi:hypothetical protein